jgi:hypothetical protein
LSPQHAGTRLSLDAIKRRLQGSAVSGQYSSMISRDSTGAGSSSRSGGSSSDRPAPLFVADVTLMLPKVVVKPSFEAIQTTLNKGIQTIIRMSESVPPWDHLIAMQQQHHHQKSVSDSIILLRII